MNQLATTVSEREKGRFPSQPKVNPNIQLTNHKPYQANSCDQVNQANSIFTLRSRKQFDNHVGTKNENVKNLNCESNSSHLLSNQLNQPTNSEFIGPIDEPMSKNDQVKFDAPLEKARV